ncbi:MAG TPA: O-antigen ligase family protein [Vicinamibacterales bacterium]
MTTTTTALDAPLFRGDKLEAATIGALLGFLAASQLSVAPAYIMLAITFACWAAVVKVHHERVHVPTMFWLLVAYGGVTVLSALRSADPAQSLIDCKQLVLFLIVPVVYRFARGPRALTFATVIISVGAISAVIGIAQYGVLHYDNLGKRPQGTLTHYMTYSGVLMLVTCAAAARLLFRKGMAGVGADRLWTALVMPALIVAQALTFTRSAWIGTCAGIATLFVLKDRRLLAALPVGVALLMVLAPAEVTARMYSVFDVNDPSNRDRMAMLQSGVEMVRDHPLTGVGPDMVKTVYHDYRQPWAVNQLNPHLHNVPMHIAAERGLPALVIWIGFIIYLVRDLFRRLHHSRYPSLAAGGLAAIVAMVCAGQFEYNFGDSEFLMLFLVLITLPYASDRRSEDANA